MQTGTSAPNPAAKARNAAVSTRTPHNRASKRSAQWCLDAVDVCWKAKSPRIRAADQAAAAEAFDVARQAYRKILGESAAD